MTAQLVVDSPSPTVPVLTVERVEEEYAPPWVYESEAAGFFRVTRWVIDAEAWRQGLGFEGGERNINSDIIAETYEAAGAYVMGRRMADGGRLADCGVSQF